MRNLLASCFLLLASISWALPKDPNYPLGNARLLTQTLSYIQRYYVDPVRIHPLDMFEASLNYIQRTAPEILAKCEKPSFCAVTVQQATKRFKYPAKDLGSLGSTLKEIFQFIELHVDKDTDKQEIEFSAIDGLLNELDPHSNFLSPDSYREFRVGTEGEFGGLGIVIGLKEGRLTVTAPIEGTPAWKAGVKAGDHISQINEESSINMTLTEAVERLRGPVGTKVTIKIERSGRPAPIALTLKRAIINIEAVQSKLVITPQGNNVGFIRVKSFQANTEQDFHDQLEALAKPENNIKGVILDLRNNPGGLLDQAVTMADEFLKDGVIVSTVGPGGKLIDRKKARADGFEGNWPLIILVNEGSASASEIVAGALKNNNRAIVVGNKTFGKGSVQSVYELATDAALKLTVAQYLTPGNQSIQSVGITPDIELRPVVVDKDHLDTIENITTTEKDLEKHFDGQPTRGEQPIFKLGFLAPTPKENEETEYHPELRLENDTAAEMALALTDAFSSSNRAVMLEEAQHLLKERKVAEEKKVVASFQKIGIDWNLGEQAGQPQAELTFHLLKDGKPIKRAPASENVTLRIQLKNVGDAPYYRLAAQSDSKEMLFKNIEFAFGKVLPGAIKTWETKLKLPPSALTEEVGLKLKFKQEDHGNVVPDVNVIMPIQGAKRPLFAHQYFLDGNPSQIVGGKPVDLTVKITNQGEGVSNKPVVALRNLSGKEIFIEKGRVSMDALSPGQSANASLRFHTDPSWNGESFRMELSITDSDLLVNSKQEITIKMADAKIDPPANTLFSPPVITLATKAVTSDKNPFVIQGEVKDDQTVRDLFIFLDDKKVFYESNAKQGASFPFQIPITLSKGNNVVVITARDNFNLISRQFLVVNHQSTPTDDIAASED
ncbi:MAG: hypothetical protein A2W61_03975 [Deltaproteobacteria bacterium RIFCSPLOWO2_01_44_7]|nr:MAG: hypothetical protein A2712_04050 [Deltaproteobacteria bacterium RIFCSPHIGHO2_01_FULL_43_49]OGQ16357.1 MAG: hypothetical protein A3D22_02020 [Deltaproteobacteria bacterium RIFCSPHIGHO2_02_FULL_44_53]OGQ29317.1 MAG: hypothetical protein A3D98_05805 [Deltaproteobacteria bacterium RIFCSPHIGHO2_12_FULL_44_21]OGQ32875.1 MAG: hypothetical protein A2979_09950 [Deltaproteobacteria bacterium RIFCSPLOWO2_01_FULL_45_74]OGQ41976.1 MAG: hypothetical protein A3I70_09735 [Deltaproteobacteria bacterium 